MAKNLILSFTFILLMSFPAAAKYSVDTTDNWSVLYNDKVIARYNEVDKNPPISIKTKAIRPGDILTVHYFCDAPNSDAKTCIYILDYKNHKTVVAKGKGTFSPLKISLKDILDKIKGNKQRYLDFYYFDERRNRLIFQLKLE